MIMTLSMKKIVESRGRRGGASLHRNLLVAGVLFKARDVLLTESVVAAADDSSDKPPPPSSCDDYDADDPDVDRKWRDENDDDEEMDCERTAASSPCDVCCPSDGKENVPPSNQTPDHPPCDDVPQPSTDRGRAGKRLSRDSADDDVTPCKTTRADADGGLAEAAMDVDSNDAASGTAVGDEPCRQTCSLPPCLVVTSSTVARWSSAVSRLPCLDARLTQNVAADPSLVRPLLVVQVV